ncbi:30S ribosomal protein S2 [Geodia barretti]|uniref:30S ribosomal protein S2 n=2 Tax=Geodia barretti TaxID=519541 RepID=A0AA35W6X0_GEOBA|nr:30S ribosomal protein S2 [Geodia barretti]
MIRGGGTGERTANGSARIQHAPASRSRRAFRAPDAALEPEDALLSVRRAERRSRYRSGADRSSVASGARRAARRRRRGRAHPLRRHQAAGLQADRRDRPPLRPVLCQPPLAGRDADELEGDFGSIKTLADLESTLADEAAGLTKKEMLQLVRRRNKLDLALGGIRDMGGVPDVLVVIDTNKEDIAILEARKLGIPVVAIIDSNCDPDLITHPIPGNDDAIRAINLYCDLFARAVIDGLQVELAASGADIGAAEEGLAEDLPPADGGATETAEEAPADGAAAPDTPADTTADTTADAGAAPPAPEAPEGGGEEQAAGA